MKKKEEEKRIFIKSYMSKESYDWITAQAKEFGVTKSALVNICVGNYKQQCEMSKMMSSFEDMLKRLERLKGCGEDD